MVFGLVRFACVFLGAGTPIPVNLLEHRRLPDRMYLAADVLPAIASKHPRMIVWIGVTLHSVELFPLWRSQSDAIWVTVDSNPNNTHLGSSDRHCTIAFEDLVDTCITAGQADVVIADRVIVGSTSIDDFFIFRMALQRVLAPGGILVLGRNRHDEGLCCSLDSFEGFNPLSLSGLPWRRSFSDCVFDILESGEQRTSLMIIAHPDDETLFGSGLLMEGGERWTILSLTGASNPTRVAEFHEACNLAGATPMMWDYKDSANFGTLGGATPAAYRLQELLRSAPWHRVVSHSEVGEYCHPQHIETHEVVRTLVSPEDFWVFQPLDLRSWNAHNHSVHHAAQRRELLACYDSQSSILRDFSWVWPGAVPLRSFDKWHVVGLARENGRCL